MNAELLIAAKKVVQRLEHLWKTKYATTVLSLPEEVVVLKRLIIRAEDEMEREAMWYEYQRKNANREYNEMMLRGEE
tara:strand:- start:53 stop:283 length:231 start_codon:yes stop_codon:yes gene_type:complete